MEHTIQAFRSYSWKVITNTHIKLNVNKESNNYESKNETNIFSSWQSGIGSKLERDFKLTEKFSGFITRRAGKSISGLVDAVSSIETPLTTPKGKGGAKLVGNLDATSTKKRILRKKKAESAPQQVLNAASLFSSLQSLPKQLQYDFERRSRARKSAEAVSSPQLLLPTGDGDDDDYEFDENEFDENEYEYEYEDSDGNTIAEIAVNFNKAPQSVSGDRVIINNSINIDSEITDAPVQGYQYKQTEEFTNNNIATRVIDVDDSEEDSILTNTFIRGNNAGNGNSDSYNDGGVVFEGIVRAQESTINNSFSTTTSATVSTTTNKIANKIKNSDDNDEEEKEVISTATIRNKVNIITSNDNNPNNQIIDSEGSITNSPSQQKSLAESALLAADLVFFLAEKIANAVGPVIAGTTGNILEQVANNLRIGEPTQSELVNGWLDEKDKENSDSCSGQSDISGSGSSTTDYSTATTTTSINSTKQTGIMTLINGGNESAPEVPKQRWKSVMRVESTKPNSKNK